MPAKRKLSEAEVKTMRRRLQAGARRSELARAYGVNRKTIKRRLDALELAEAERAAQSEPGGTPAQAPGQASTPAVVSAAGSARFPPGTHEAWLDERDARLPAAPDPPVRLVTEGGRTVGSTRESNAAQMAAALEPRYGPLSVVPA